LFRTGRRAGAPASWATHLLLIPRISAAHSPFAFRFEKRPTGLPSRPSPAALKPGARPRIPTSCPAIETGRPAMRGGRPPGKGNANREGSTLGGLVLWVCRIDVGECRKNHGSTKPAHRSREEGSVSAALAAFHPYPSRSTRRLGFDDKAPRSIQASPRSFAAGSRAPCLPRWSCGAFRREYPSLSVGVDTGEPDATRRLRAAHTSKPKGAAILDHPLFGRRRTGRRVHGNPASENLVSTYNLVPAIRRGDSSKPRIS